MAADVEERDAEVERVNLMEELEGAREPVEAWDSEVRLAIGPFEVVAPRVEFAAV